MPDRSRTAITEKPGLGPSGTFTDLEQVARISEIHQNIHNLWAELQAIPAAPEPTPPFDNSRNERRLTDIEIDIVEIFRLLKLLQNRRTGDFIVRADTYINLPDLAVAWAIGWTEDVAEFWKRDLLNETWILFATTIETVTALPAIPADFARLVDFDGQIWGASPSASIWRPGFDYSGTLGNPGTPEP